MAVFPLYQDNGISSCFDASSTTFRFTRSYKLFVWHDAVAVSSLIDVPNSGSTKHPEFQHVQKFAQSLHKVPTGHLLGIVLYVGNYLNGGTPRGRADGFALDTLVLMRTVKM